MLLAACVATQAAPAAAATAEPRSAAAFRDSVGVSTHIVYYDTAYGDWPRVVDRLRELGVAHVRDGVYANPAPQWRAWNERYYHAVDLAAAHGIRFAFGMGRPGSPAGTIGQLLDVVGGRLRHAAAALEAPNEFDHFVGGPRWPARLAAYGRELYRKAKARRAVRSLPVVGLAGGARLCAAPRRPAPLARRGEHPSLHGRALARPAAPALGARADRARCPAASPSGRRRPASTTRCAPARVSRRSPRRPAPSTSFSRKPAFIALRNLLAVVGPATPPGRLRPLRLEIDHGARDLRSLVLQRADGRHLLILWRTAQVWDRVAPPARRPRASASPVARSSWRSSPAARAADRARR